MSLPRLQASCFARDVVLYVGSRDEAEEMLPLFGSELASMGLQLDMTNQRFSPMIFHELIMIALVS